MSRRLFDFQCKVGHTHEHLTDSEIRTVKCETCGKPAKRLISAVRCQLEGLTGDFPGAAMKWESNRESHMKKERKTKANHDSYK